jgi:hypothetical protein
VVGFFELLDLRVHRAVTVTFYENEEATDVRTHDGQDREMRQEIRFG